MPVEVVNRNPYVRGFCWHGIKRGPNSDPNGLRVCGIEGAVLYIVKAKSRLLADVGSEVGPHAFMYLCNYHADQLRKKYDVKKVDTLDSPV